MIKTAESNAAQDKERRVEAEARNEADSAVYQVERLLKDEGELPPSEKGAVEQKLTALREALKNDAPVDRIKSLTAELQQEVQKLTQAAQASAACGDCGGSNCGGSGYTAADDVVDAEFEEK